MIPVTFNAGAPGIGLNRRVTLFSPGSSLMKDAFNYAVSPFQPITFSPRPPVPGREADGVRLGFRLFTPLLLRCFDISFAKDRRWGTGVGVEGCWDSKCTFLMLFFSIDQFP